MTNDSKIRKKIHDTKLFTDAQKVELLVGLDEITASEKRQLEESIDTFDLEYRQAVDKHTQQVRSLLGHLTKHMTDEQKKKHQDTLDEIELGLSLLSA